MARFGTDVSAPLLSVGLDTAASFVNLVDDYSSMEEMVKDIFETVEKEDDIVVLVAALERLHHSAVVCSGRESRRVIAATCLDIALHASRQTMKRDIVDEDGGHDGAFLEAPRAVVPARWPKKAKKAVLDTDVPRQHAEDIKRMAIVDAAGELAREAGLPLAIIASRSARPQEALRRIGQGRRYRTIEKRVSSWRKARAYFLATSGSPWPRDVEHAINYVEELASGDAPPSCLWCFYFALGFFEKGGGVAVEKQIGKDPNLKACIEELCVNLLSKSGAPRRKAPRIPLAMLLLWEDLVVNVHIPIYERMYAWFQCVRVWASLRFDDHRGMDPASIRLTKEGLTAVLSRTKVSGRDKKIEALPVFVSSSAYVFHTDWLEIGWGFWEAVPHKRDFFLVMPSEDRHGTLKIEVEYADALAMTKAQLLTAKAVAAHNGEITRHDTCFLDVAAAAYWTEHSPRATLASWVACLGTFPADWPDLLGRWGSCKAEGYVRTHRKRVKAMQEAVASKIREDKDPHVLFDEGPLLEELRAYLSAKGMTEADVAKTIANLLITGAMGPRQGICVESSRDVSMEDSRVKKADVDIGHDTKDAEKVNEDNDHKESGDGSDQEEVVLKSVGGHGTFEYANLLGQYVVSVSGKTGKTRRLHKVGECFRKPGVDYRNFVVLGFEEPAPSEYSHQCQHCWSGKRARAAPSSSSSSSSSSSASASTGRETA